MHQFSFSLTSLFYRINSSIHVWYLFVALKTSVCKGNSTRIDIEKKEKKIVFSIHNLITNLVLNHKRKISNRHSNHQTTHWINRITHSWLFLFYQPRCFLSYYSFVTYAPALYNTMNAYCWACMRRMKSEQQDNVFVQAIHDSPKWTQLNCKHDIWNQNENETHTLIHP